MLNEPCHLTDHGKIAPVPIIINMTVTRNMMISACIAPVTPSLAIIRALPIHVIDRQCSRKMIVKVNVTSAHPTARSNRVYARAGNAAAWVNNFKLARLISDETMINAPAHRTVRIGQASISSGDVAPGLVMSDVRGWRPESLPTQIRFLVTQPRKMMCKRDAEG